MQQFEMTITISVDGETVTGEIQGIKGKSCSNVAAVLDAIGKELEHHHTSEYHETEPVRFGHSTTGKLRLGGS